MKFLHFPVVALNATYIPLIDIAKPIINALEMKVLNTDAIMLVTIKLAIQMS